MGIRIAGCDLGKVSARFVTGTVEDDGRLVRQADRGGVGGGAVHTGNTPAAVGHPRGRGQSPGSGRRR